MDTTAVDVSMLVPLPVDMLKQIDFTEIAIYLVHGNRPVLYKNRGVPLTDEFLTDLYERLQSFYILRSDTKIVVSEIGKRLQEAFSKPAYLSNVKEIFDQITNLVDMVLTTPSKENLNFVRQFTSDLAEYVEENSNAAYLVAFTVKKDFVTAVHMSNVGALVSGFAYHLGLRGGEYKRLVVAAFLHDMGKTRVPEDILKKPGKLSLREFEVMKKHTVWGAKLLRENGMDEYADVAMYHHEYLDGSGYPEGLKGEKIPFEARIVQICDVYEALTGIRPYRDSMIPFDALRLLRDEFVLKGKIGKDLYSDFLIFLYRNRYD